jgi:ABC-type transporter Mla MlaB component
LFPRACNPSLLPENMSAQTRKAALSQRILNINVGVLGHVDSGKVALVATSYALQHFSTCILHL